MNVKWLGAASLLLGLTAQSFALNFGVNVIVDGNSYTVGGGTGANGISVQQVGDTLAFALPNAVAIGAPKTLNLQYSVFADPGFSLTTINQIAGNGIATGTASVDIATNFVGVTNETAPTISYPAGSGFGPVSYSFTSSPSQWTTVNTVINLNGVGGIAKVSTYNANYTQAVPEPVSAAILASGLGGLLLRRRAAKK